MRTSGTLARVALAALLVATGALAALGTLSPEPALPAAPSAVVEALVLDPAASVAPPAAAYVSEERLRRGDTLAGLLSRLGIAEGHAARLARVRALRELRPGTDVRAEVGAEGAPIVVAFLAERDRLVEIRAEGEGFRAAERQPEFEIRAAMKAGVIRTSLFAAADAAGVPDAIAIQLADVFGGEIDFHRDLRKGDRFAVVYEVQAFAGRPVRAGRVLAAEFVNQGRTYRAVHYDGGYYTPEGGNLRKTFLRAPLEFSRISSGFGKRLHPLFRTWRAHEGVDYAAPAGTKVRATGDGVVEFIGNQGGYGKLVVLRHGGSYSTAYAHLSRFAPGLRRGARVAQGDTLGHVGQTGWATGPHLHYEFRVAGVARNPRTIALPAGRPVPAAALAAFRDQAATRLAQLDLLADSRLALLE